MEKFPHEIDQGSEVEVANSATESLLDPGETEGLLSDPEIDDAIMTRAQHRELGDKILNLQDNEGWKRQSTFVEAQNEPDYNTEVTAEQLLEHPERRFDVNPDRFPILRDQAIDNQRVNINETLGLLVQDTADTIARITGETDPPTRRSDAVIYLDKSARPVSWLVNELWEDFTQEPRPDIEEFMGIDRVNWFRAAGLDVDGNGNLNEDYGTSRKNRRATYKDFKQAVENHPIPRSDIARARLLLIPDGLRKLRDSMTETEQTEFDSYNPLAFESTKQDDSFSAPKLPDWLVEKIFALPTGLEGKKVTIVDEVQSSGATLEIARDIVSKAINDPKTEIIMHTFWRADTRQTSDGEAQMLSTPVWYDHDVNPELGKGIGDVDFGRAREEFANHPDLENLRALYIAPFRGRKLDLAGAEGESSVELMQEFQRLAQIYREGRVLMTHPKYYDEEKWIEYHEDLGVEFVPDLKRKNSYVAIRDSFKNQ